MAGAPRRTRLPHGRSRYCSYRCRCRICTAANTAYSREYRRVRKLLTGEPLNV